MDFPYSVLEGYTVYTTLTCENNAGLTSMKSSNGVRISNQPPSITAVEVEVLPLSNTEYIPSEKYQGVTDSMRIKWSGFTDSIGVETYQVSLHGYDKLFNSAFLYLGICKNSLLNRTVY